MSGWFAPCLAAIDPFALKAIILIVMGLIYMFNKLVGGAKAQQHKPPRPEARMRPPSPARQEVNDEVAEFLRRTAERTAQRTGKKPPEPQPAATGRRPLVERHVAPLSSELVDVEAIDEPPTGAGVASHVAQHLDRSGFDQRAAQLGSVEQEERTFQDQVDQTFDHQVGHLAMRGEEPAPGAQAPAAPVAAQTIAALLADPQNFRGAIVLNEILQRPTDRW